MSTKHPSYPTATISESEQAIIPDERARRNRHALAVLDSFLDDDAEEQRETLESLAHSLDEDRPAGFRLFS